MSIKYELTIYWSEGDQSFMVEVPELPGCMADGATYEEAVANARKVIDEWLDTAHELGRQIPLPGGLMNTQHIENLIDSHLQAGQANFEISKSRRALVLSVPENSELVGPLEKMFNSGMARLVPLDRQGKIKPTPLFHIDGYSVSPTLREKRAAKGYCLYDFFYALTQNK